MKKSFFGKITHTLSICICLFLCGLSQGQSIPYSIALESGKKYAVLVSSEELKQTTHLVIQHDTRVKYWKNRAKLPLKIIFYSKNDSTNLPDLPISQTEIIVYNPDCKSKILIDLKDYTKFLKENTYYISVEAFSEQWYIDNGYLTEKTYFYIDKNNQKWYILPQLKCFKTLETMFIYNHNKWEAFSINNFVNKFNILSLQLKK